MSYQAYPRGGDSPVVPPHSGAVPRPVHNAVRLMYAGAVLSLIELVLGLVSTGSYRSKLKTTKSNSGHPLTAAQINSFATVLVVVTIVVGVIAVGLWLLMARVCGRGRSWGRIVSSILFGLSTLYLLLSLTGAGASLVLLPVVLTWLVGLGAIVYLWQRPSSEYFKSGGI